MISTGEVVENPKPLSLAAKRIARHQRRLARQQTGAGARPASKRSRRTRARIARTHAKAAHLRADTLQKLTTCLATTYGTVVVEDLNVAGMTARPTPRSDPERPGHHLPMFVTMRRRIGPRQRFGEEQLTAHPRKAQAHFDASHPK